jgi:hypothetical protein
VRKGFKIMKSSEALRLAAEELRNGHAVFLCSSLNYLAPYCKAHKDLQNQFKENAPSTVIRWLAVNHLEFYNKLRAEYGHAAYLTYRLAWIEHSLIPYYESLGD